MSMKGESELQKMEPTMRTRVDAYEDLERFLNDALKTEERRALELSGWSPQAR